MKAAMSRDPNICRAGPYLRKFYCETEPYHLYNS